MSVRVISLIIIFGIVQNFRFAHGWDRASDVPLSWLDSFSSMKGNFLHSQSTSHDENEIMSSGSFAILKPDYFMWHVTAPDNQLLVSDGSYIWHHDEDLQTLTKRKVSGEISSLQIILGNSNTLVEQFLIVPIQVRNQYVLTPKNPDHDFVSINLIFEKNALKNIKILDRLGYEQIITFMDLQYDPALLSSDFTINSDKNMDLLYDERF